MWKLSLLGDEWSPLRALSACGQILHKNPGKGQTPPHSGNAWILGVSVPGTPPLRWEIIVKENCRGLASLSKFSISS